MLPKYLTMLWLGLGLVPGVALGFYALALLTGNGLTARLRSRRRRSA
jgi:hypothetical protein